MLPALIGISGHEVGAEEEAAIRRWQPAGFILFSRNIDSVEQVRGLTESLRKLCLHHPVIAVDQEGGRVVRTASLGLNLPSPASLARLGSGGGVGELGAVTALALRYLGVNLNFAPVLDICHDPSAANALPGRCWGDNAQDVISRGGVYASNLRRGGVQSCGKHFPGHGWAEADSHVACPTDNRSAAQIRRDLSIYRGLALELESIMTAHVAYQCFDGEVATYSPRLLKTILREELGFSGLIFSDDLSMKGACGDEPPLVRAQKALAAGCDMVLHCNHPEEADEMLAGLEWSRTPAFDERLARLLPDEAESVLSMEALRAEPRWQRAEELLADIEGFRAA